MYVESVGTGGGWSYGGEDVGCEENVRGREWGIRLTCVEGQH